MIVKDRILITSNVETFADAPNGKISFRGYLLSRMAHVKTFGGY